MGKRFPTTRIAALAINMGTNKTVNLFLMVVARDVGHVAPGLFAADTFAGVGENAYNGMEVVAPVPAGLEKHFCGKDRHRALDRRMIQLLQSWFPYVVPLLPELGLQSVAHQLCEQQQQTARVRFLPRQPPRSDDELRLFAVASFGRLGLQHMASKIRLPRKVPEGYTDEEVLALLRRAHPEAKLATGWRKDIIDNLLEPASKRSKFR